MANLIVTIDGPAASGKSTVARLLAERLGASFLDTGAMYRAVTLAAMQTGVNMSNEERLLDVLDKRKFQFAIKKNKMAVSIDGVDVTEQIRGPEVTANAQHIASAAKIREKLVEMQRQFVVGEDKIVTEGRDQGTVAFPNADIKFYLTAETIERARRRQAELYPLQAGRAYGSGEPSPDPCRRGGASPSEGRGESLEQIQRAIEERDKSDQRRSVGPLKPAGDAVVIDTTDLSIEEVVEKLCVIVTHRSSRPALPKGGARPSKGRGSWPGPRETSDKRRATFKWFRFARWLCKVFCMTFFKLHPAGRENVPEEGPLVLIGNHQSFLDPMLCGIFVKRPLYFLARDTLFANWFFGWLISSVNTIPVKRGSADLAAMKTIIRKLKEGNGLCLFPEATRSSDGRITPFKPGFGLLCRRGNAAIVPVLIDGAFESWPRHKKIFSPGGHIAIHYGKCISAEYIKKMSDRELAELLTDTLRRMQNDCRVKQGKEPYNY